MHKKYFSKTLKHFVTKCQKFTTEKQTLAQNPLFHHQLDTLYDPVAVSMNHNKGVTKISLGTLVRKPSYLVTYHVNPLTCTSHDLGNHLCNFVSMVQK